MSERSKLLSRRGKGKQMEKKEVQKFIKNKMKELGFRSRGNGLYKILDDNYLIGIYMDHHSYCKGYYIEYGVIYLPDDEKMPFRGDFDWSSRFFFTTDPEDDLSKYHFDVDEVDEDSYGKIIEYFEYDVFTLEELDAQLDLNIKKLLPALLDKNFVLEFYKKKLSVFTTLSTKTQIKLIKRGNYNLDIVNKERLKWEMCPLVIE